MSDDEVAAMDRVAAARRRGDHLATFDCASEGLARWPHAPHLHYAAILALARSGALQSARERFDRFRTSGLLESVDDPSLLLDVATLDARLHKDAWLRSTGAAARMHALRSAAAYAAAHVRFGSSYPAVNAATMFLAAGALAEARSHAAVALEAVAGELPSFWRDASLAEAALVLGDAGTAAAALDRAAALQPGLDAVATARRQIVFVAEAVGLDPAIIDHLPVPPVGFWVDDGATMPDALPAASPNPAGGIVFGVVAGPADVQRAAALVAGGAELTLVLPCEPAAWLASFAADPEGALPARFRRLLAAAVAVVAVTREGRADDPAALDLCRRQARGLARLRAAALHVAPRELAGSGPRTDELPIGSDAPIAASTAPIASASPGGREAHAIVFGDVRGFSRLSEAHQIAFLDTVVGGFAAVLDADGSVEFAETAGDGLYLVFPDVVAAARCCFALREVLDPARMAGAGLPSHLGLRLSGHVGPVFRRFDPVIRREKFCGAEVVRTARIEPVTPVGEIYVTEQFAAVLADSSGDYACDYAGLQPMAKGYGACRMYALRRARD